MKYKHLFGPVPSRRLGLSLGIDLVTKKTCNLNCIFCECGETPKTDSLRKNFKNIIEIKSEIIEALKEIQPDYITFSGSGEPTLSKDLGNIINFIKKDLNYKGKIALITNSTLLSDPKVIDEIILCDLIIPTINTLKEDIFQKISRAKKVNVDSIKKGLTNLSSSNYKGKIFLELFILEGINDCEDNLMELSDFIKTIRYDKLQINSLARPGADKNLTRISSEKLFQIKNYLENQGLKNVEIIVSLKDIPNKMKINKSLFSNMLEKREYSNDEIFKIYKNNDIK